VTSPYAEAEAAFAAGYAAASEAESFWTSRPGEGVRLPCGGPGAGLGYAAPPDPVPVFEADNPGLVPHVLPVPQPDASPPESVTGAAHGGWR